MRSRMACFLFVAAWSASALADPTKDQCIDADTRAQTLRMQGKFHDARAALEVCTSSACPAMVRQDCTERLDELNRVAPSLIFDVKDSSGRDVSDASVTMDGKPLVARIGAEAVPVDPGDHDLVVSARGHLPNKLHVLVHEGDKDRRVAVTVGTAAVEPEPEEKPETTAAPPPARSTEEHAEQPPEKPAASSGSGMRVAAVAFGITGIAGLVLGGVFAGLASDNWNNSKALCSDALCPSATRPDAVSDHDTALGFANASTATFIIGGALAATGIILFILAPHHQTESGAIRATPMIGAGGGGLMLSGAFR